MPDLGLLRSSSPTPGLTPPCSRCGRTTARCCSRFDGLTPGPSDDASDTLLLAAEAAAREALAGGPAEELPHVAAWREAYRAFGAKPQRTRNSLEALLRRAESGLPRVNRLTDLYNAVSVLHQVPLGGEDLTPLHQCAAAHPSHRHGALRHRRRRRGGHRAPRLRRGRVVRRRRRDLPALELAPGSPYPAPRGPHHGAVHPRRTRPMTSGALNSTADDLVARLARLGPDIRAARRLIAAGTPAED